MHNGWVHGAGSLATKRQKRVLDRYQRWNVVPDGEIVDSEAHDRTCDVPGEAGTHALSIGHRWWASPVLSVAVQQGETVRFAWRPRPHPVIWFPCWVASLHRQNIFTTPEFAKIDHRLAPMIRGALPTAV
jgi:hypothetical protein